MVSSNLYFLSLRFYIAKPANLDGCIKITVDSDASPKFTVASDVYLPDARRRLNLCFVISHTEVHKLPGILVSDGKSAFIACYGNNADGREAGSTKCR